MKHLRKYILIVLCLALFVAVLSACGKTSDEECQNSIATSVIETLTVGETRTAIARPSDTPVPTPTMVPTSTSVPTLAQPTVDMTSVYGITQSPIPAVTQQSNTPTAANAVERADWASSAPADGTLIDGGTKFKVKFSIINNGNTTWNTNYYVQHVDGPKWGAVTKLNMPAEIGPGLSASFEIEFTAQTTPGTARSNWAVYNANNVAIGFFYFEYKFD